MKHLYATCGTQFQVSDEDEIFLAGFTWKLKGVYICGSGNRYKDRYLHRIIAERMGIDFTNQIDHRDRNPLNNQRSNLRPATHSQNAMNRKMQANNISNVTGVHWDKDSQNWRASITVRDKKINLGNFDNFKQASEVRKQAEVKYFGEFARNGDSNNLGNLC